MIPRSFFFSLTLLFAASSSFAALEADNSQASPNAQATSVNTKKAQVVLLENFDNTSLPTSLGLWGNGVSLSLVQSPTESFGGKGKSLKAVYPTIPVPDGAWYPGGGVSLAQYNTDHVYVRFRAKMPKHTHGLKFLKVFGKHGAGDSYANTTFGLDYTGVESGTGSMYCTSFGDGAGVSNDTATIIGFSGTGGAGRAAGLPGHVILRPQNMAFLATDWGTSWHLFELYVKFNSGTTAQNEKNDGEVQVTIDGKVYVDAKGLFNRHYSNEPIDRIEILGWSQNQFPAVFENGAWVRHELATPQFEIWYDNIEVTLDNWIMPNKSLTPVIDSLLLD